MHRVPSLTNYLITLNSAQLQNGRRLSLVRDIGEYYGSHHAP